jgi:ABC-2 type transport system permease protein
MIWKLIHKDLLRHWHNPSGILLLIALPLLMAVLMWLVFGGQSEEKPLPRIRLLIEDRDKSFASEFLAGAFSRAELAKMFEPQAVAKDEGRDLMNQGKASALLIIPAGFGDSLLSQRPTGLQVIKNPSESFLPKIAEETVIILGEAADRFVRIGAEPLARIKSQMDRKTDFSDAQIASLAIQLNQIIPKVSKFLFPPLIALESASQAPSKKTRKGDFFAYILTGISLMAIFFMLEMLARDFFREKEKRTLYRLLIGPIGTRQFILAKLFILFFAGMFSFALVWLTGVLLFDVSIAHPSSFIAIGTAAIAALTGIIGLLFAMVRTRAQGSAIAPAVIIVFSMLGGSMVPLNSLPAFLRKIGMISPVYWGVDGLQKALFSENVWADLRLNLVLLLLLSVVFNFLAFILFDRKIRL